MATDRGDERDRLRTATRSRIVEAAFSLLHESPPDTPFSHETVAAHAGVAARTAYRHFPTQDDLVAAVWRHLRDTTGTRWPARESEIIPLLHELFEQFERNATLTRAMLAALPRANYAAHGADEGRRAFTAALAERCVDWSPDETRQLVASCLAIYSAPFWQLLRDRGALSAPAAAAAAADVMRAVLRHAHPHS
jgi:AcrR family transcriptional regulator